MKSKSLGHPSPSSLSSFSMDIDISASSSALHNDNVFQRRHERKCEEMILLLKVMLLKTIWSLVTTIVPVYFAVIGSNDLHPEYYGWYQGGDIVRFMEPVGGLLFSFWIFQASGILKYDSRSISLDLLVSMFYAFGVSLYMQGGAFHSASNMFKHGIRIYLDDYLPIESIDTTQEEMQREYMEDFYYWMRTVWQHIVSHYIYATGALITDLCILFAYRSHKLEFHYSSNRQNRTETSISPLRDINLTSGTAAQGHELKASEKTLVQKNLTQISLLVIINGFFYGALLSAVAINFPSGVIVGIIYFPLFLIFSIRNLHSNGCFELWGKEKWQIVIASRPVVFLFVFAHLIAMFIVVMWIAVVGGFKKRSEVM